MMYFSLGINVLILSCLERPINTGLGIDIFMKNRLEYFNATSVVDYESIQSIVDELPDNIYFFGHRLEDDIYLKTLREDYDLTFYQQYKDSVVGRTNKEQFIVVVDFLKNNFIAGYIIWFNSIVDFTPFEFGELFFKSRYASLLASIYRARHSSTFSYDIDVPNEIKGKIKGMVFTDSGESDFMLLKPYCP